MTLQEKHLRIIPDEIFNLDGFISALVGRSTKIYRSPDDAETPRTEINDTNPKNIINEMRNNFYGYSFLINPRFEYFVHISQKDNKTLINFYQVIFVYVDGISMPLSQEPSEEFLDLLSKFTQQ